MNQTAETRFFAKVKKTDGCWVWEGGGGRYGSFWIDGRNVGAHCYSWKLSCGEIPRGLSVLHTCDNPLCVKPGHLFLGTQADNIVDRDRKGRQSRGDNHYSRLHPERLARGDSNGLRAHPESVRRGESNGMAKLTEKDVLVIRTSNEPGPRLAARMGVDRALITRIRARKAWKHVLETQP